MGKFLSTIIGLIIAAVAFGFLWLFIPLVSSILSTSPFYMACFICGLFFLASFFSLKIFKSKYMKIMPVVLALVLGGITVRINYDRYGRMCYNHGVLIKHDGVYNKFGSKILGHHSGQLSVRYTSDGTPVIVDFNTYYTNEGIYNSYTVYTMDGVCIAKNVNSLDDIM